MTFQRSPIPRNICGSKVRQIRTSLEWSQPKLAAECQLAGLDISRDAIAWIEAGKRRVSDWELKILAKVLRTPIAELVGGD